MHVAKTFSAYIARQFSAWFGGVFAAMVIITFLLDYIELIRRGGAKIQATLGLLLEMAGSLWRFWLVRGPWREGRTWIAKGLELDSDAAPASVRAKALAAAGGLAIEQGDLDAAGPFLEQSLALWQQLGSTAGSAHALNFLGTLAMARFEYGSWFAVVAGLPLSP